MVLVGSDRNLERHGAQGRSYSIALTYLDPHPGFLRSAHSGVRMLPCPDSCVRMVSCSGENMNARTARLDDDRAFATP